MSPLHTPPIDDRVPAADPEYRRGLGTAWTLLKRGLWQAGSFGGAVAERSGSGRRADEVATRDHAGQVVLSLSGGVLHASASAHGLLGEPLASLRAELEVLTPDECCRGALTGADGDRLEVHAVRGAWGGDPAWIGMLSRAPQRRHARIELELALVAAQRVIADLERQASVDTLTSLLNRRGLEAALARETARRRHTGEPLAAVLIDCDDFKRVNDSRGHSVGDQVLRQVARCLQKGLRPSDHLGRIGGDEFLVLLPDTGAADALRIAQRLRLAVADRPLRGPGGAVKLTVSLGLALLTDGDCALEDVVARTDISLHRSKSCGKNRLSTAGTDVAPEVNLA